MSSEYRAAGESSPTLNVNYFLLMLLLTFSKKGLPVYAAYGRTSKALDNIAYAVYMPQEIAQQMEIEFGVHLNASLLNASLAVSSSHLAGVPRHRGHALK